MWTIPTLLLFVECCLFEYCIDLSIPNTNHLIKVLRTKWVTIIKIKKVQILLALLLKNFAFVSCEALHIIDIKPIMRFLVSLKIVFGKPMLIHRV